MSHETSHRGSQHQQHADLDIQLLTVEHVDMERCITELGIGENPMYVEDDGHCVRSEVQALPPCASQLTSKVRGDYNEDQSVQCDRAKRIDAGLLRSIQGIDDVDDPKVDLV